MTMPNPEVDIPMNYWPRFHFRAALSELRWTDETKTEVVRVFFEEDFSIGAMSVDSAIRQLKNLVEFRGVTLEQLFRKFDA